MDVTNDTFPQDVIERSKELPVIVDFWASWWALPHARPSDRVRSRQAAGKDRTCEIDVDAEQELAGRYGIQSIPTVAAFRRWRSRDGISSAHIRRARLASFSMMSLNGAGTAG